MKEWLEYAAVWAILKNLGCFAARHGSRRWQVRLPQAYMRHSRSCSEQRNSICRLAFPEWDVARRSSVIRGMVRNLGWMAAEFARMPRYTRENIEQVLVLDGHENFLAGQRRGNGVLYLTGHIGVWELSSFAPRFVWVSVALYGAARSTTPESTRW